MLTRDAAESPVGLIGGAILGAIAGLFLVEIVLDSLIPSPVALVLSVVSSPRNDSAPSTIVSALDVLGVILGAILGARGLSASFIKLFGLPMKVEAMLNLEGVRRGFHEEPDYSKFKRD